MENTIGVLVFSQNKLSVYVYREKSNFLVTSKTKLWDNFLVNWSSNLNKFISNFISKIYNSESYAKKIASWNEVNG